jgi:peptide/nickel transport system ATP-binding protein
MYPNDRTATSGTDTVLEVIDLKTHFFTPDGVVKAVNGVSFTVRQGETLCVVGESGSGKTMTSLSIMRLVQEPPGKIVGGKILLDGTDLLQLSEAEMCRIRGKEIGMVFQDPMTALDPLYRVGHQIEETMEWHFNLSKQARHQRCVDLLRRVGIADAEARARNHPYQFSGGMAQRAMIAMALSCSPKLLIADEPSSSLDVTIQAQILDLIGDLQRETGMAMIYVTHDMGVVARIAHNVAVMYAGTLVETAPSQVIFSTPKHPYTLGLMRSVPRLDARPKGRLATIEGFPSDLIDMPEACPFAPRCEYVMERCWNERPVLREVGPGQQIACFVDIEEGVSVSARYTPSVPLTQSVSTPANLKGVNGSTLAAAMDGGVLVDVRDLSVRFRVQPNFIRGEKGGWVKAVDHVSLQIKNGETLGLVGESGSGKSTLGLAILQLTQNTSGSVWFEGQNLTGMNDKELRAMRRKMQMVFQNPIGSLAPRMTVKNVIREPMDILEIGSQAERSARVNELLKQVSLDEYLASRYPHEFSGGQCQRIGIARALAVQPTFLVLDEPVSALDVSIQAQIINLLQELRDRYKLTYLFIAHNLALVRHISDRVVVMYAGKIMEVAARDELYDNPLHPYTHALLSAVPLADPVAELQRERQILTGEIPSPLNPPSGCRFHPRCPLAIEECRHIEPPLEEKAPNHWVACIRVLPSKVGDAANSS